MNDSGRRQVAIIIIDFLLSLGVFLLCRYSGGYPRWYYLVASGLFWTLAGILTHKLQFDKYRRKRVAILSILVLNVLTYALILTSWRLAFPERCTLQGHWHPLVILTVCETVLYLAFRRLVMKKLPYLFEDIILDEKCEPSVTKGKKVEEAPSVFTDEFLKMYEATRGLGWKEMTEWFHQNRPALNDTLVLDTVRPYYIAAVEAGNRKSIIVIPPFNSIRHLNTFLAFANSRLPRGGCILLHGQTSGVRREKIYETNPSGLNHIIYCLDYLWSRVCPKLHITRWFYMLVTRGQNRNIPRVEILGRICRAGFTIGGEDMRDGEYLVAAIKTAAPTLGDRPSYGPLIRLNRIGYQGRTIGVLKFRTMYSYSEYLQKYAYERLGLQKGGKIKSDFRVNIWGTILRPIWLDEIPMIYNWLSGDLKLVGVRPLSKQYFSLYTPEMKALRITVKPGLIPPFYYEKDAPRTIEDVQASERRYIESYLKAPFATDCRYFFGSLKNIIFRHHRSR